MKYFVKILGDLEQDDGWCVLGLARLKETVCPDCMDFSDKEKLFPNISSEIDTLNHDITKFKECQYCGSTFELNSFCKTESDGVSFTHKIKRAQYL